METELLKNVRLVEFFGVFGVGSDLCDHVMKGYENDAKDDDDKLSVNAVYRGKQLNLVPADWNKSSMLRDLPLFCFPNGLRLREIGDSEPPAFFPFALTDEFGGRIYAACFSFDCELPEQVSARNREARKAAKSELLASSSNVPHSASAGAVNRMAAPHTSALGRRTLADIPRSAIDDAKRNVAKRVAAAASSSSSFSSSVADDDDDNDDDYDDHDDHDDDHDVVEVRGSFRANDGSEIVAHMDGKIASTTKSFDSLGGLLSVSHPALHQLAGTAVEEHRARGMANALVAAGTGKSEADKRKTARNVSNGSDEAAAKAAADAAKVQFRCRGRAMSLSSLAPPPCSKKVLASPALSSRRSRRYLVRKCLCIVSRWPYFTFFKSYLTALYTMTQRQRADGRGWQRSLEHYIAALVFDTPVPPPSRGSGADGVGLPRLAVGIDIEGLVLRLAAPSFASVPLVDFSLRLLFLALDTENVQLLLASVLTEKKILFTSSSYSLLTYAAEAVQALIYPFVWPHVYVPILPFNLIEAVQAPTPFIMGLHRAHVQSVPESCRSGLIVVDLDNNRILASVAVPDLPYAEARELSSAVMQHIHPELANMDSVQLPSRTESRWSSSAAAAAAHARSASDQAAWAPLAMSAELATPDDFWQHVVPLRQSSYEQHAKDEYRQNRIRLAFLDFFLALTRNYRLHMQTTDFDVEGFLARRDDKDRKFYEQFLETQAFQQLVRDSISSKPPYLFHLMVHRAQPSGASSAYDFVAGQAIALLSSSPNCAMQQACFVLPLPPAQQQQQQQQGAVGRAWPATLNKALLQREAHVDELLARIDALLAARMPSAYAPELRLLRAAVLSGWRDRHADAVMEAAFAAAAQPTLQPKKLMEHAVKRLGSDELERVLEARGADCKLAKLAELVLAERRMREQRLESAQLKDSGFFGDDSLSSSSSPAQLTDSLQGSDSMSPLPLSSSSPLAADTDCDYMSAIPQSDPIHVVTKLQLAERADERLTKSQFKKFAFQMSITNTEEEASCVFEALSRQGIRKRTIRFEKISSFVEAVKDVYAQRSLWQERAPLLAREVVLWHGNASSYKGRRGYLLITNLRVVFVWRDRTRRPRIFFWHSIERLERFNYRVMLPPGLPCIRVATVDRDKPYVFCMLQQSDRNHAFCYLKELFVAFRVSVSLDMPMFIYNAVRSVLLSEAIYRVRRVSSSRSLRATLSPMFIFQSYPNTVWARVKDKLVSLGILNLLTPATSKRPSASPKPPARGGAAAPAADKPSSLSAPSDLVVRRASISSSSRSPVAMLRDRPISSSSSALLVANKSASGGDAGTSAACDDDNGEESECTAVHLSQQVLRCAVGLFYSHAKARAGDTDSMSVDFAAIHASDEYASLLRVSHRLHACDTSSLDRDAMVAFFVNVYNALAVHAYIASGVLVKSRLGWQALTASAYYSIGMDPQAAGGNKSQIYSLSDIKHGVLRGNTSYPWFRSPRFVDTDPRLRHVQPLDARIHFVLCSHTLSSPAVFLLSSRNVDAQLDAAHRQYVHDHVKLDEAKLDIELPSLFRWFEEDFGGERRVLHHWVRNVLTKRDQARFDRIINAPHHSVDYAHSFIHESKPFRCST
jgi:DENN (AEX-3) domain/Protein of unknown function, DUF547/uDENN domain/dDENN domain